MKLSLIFFALFAILLPATHSAATDLATELKEAQQILAQGDYDKAYPLYLEQGEKHNNPLAQFTLGLFHKFAWGSLKHDDAQACAWFERSAEGAIPTGTHFFAKCLDQGIGRPADPAEAAAYYLRASELGHFMSLCSLADLYMEGRSVEKNPQKAIELCSQAAERGAPPARIKVGRYLLQGDESIRNPQAAVSWFESMADHSTEAQYYLGLIFRDGTGQPQNMDHALSWFENAAAKGYVPAYYETALIYFNLYPDYDIQKPTADHLAKAYLWLSAAIERSPDLEQQKKSKQMLDKVLTIMPDSWRSTLDERVQAHLSANPAVF